jgi:hypothetical protein
VRTRNASHHPATSRMQRVRELAGASAEKWDMDA